MMQFKVLKLKQNKKHKKQQGRQNCFYFFFFLPIYKELVFFQGNFRTNTPNSQLEMH